MRKRRLGRHDQAFVFAPEHLGIFKEFGDWRVRIVAGPIAAIFLQFGGADACAEPVSVSVFVGAMTDNRWQDLAFTPWDIDYLSSFLVGAGINIARSDPYVTCVSACNFDPLRRGVGVQF